MTGQRSMVLVYGNCQAARLCDGLKPYLQDALDLHYLANFSHGHISPRVPEDSDWSRIAFLLHQVGPMQDAFPHAGRLPSHCRTFRFPALKLMPPWPLDVVDPLARRPDPEAGFPGGRFINGDRLAMRLREQGLSLQEQLDRYLDTDMRKLFDLDRLAEMSFSEMHHADSRADLAFAPFIETNWRDLRLFGTAQHPCNLLLDRLLRNALAFLLDDPAHLDAPPPRDAMACMGAWEVPVHPQVAEHYGLKWAPPGSRWRFRSRMLDFRDYVEAYLKLEGIPEGDPPSVWQGMAEQAARRGDEREFFRLLSEGLCRHPQEGSFYVYLAMYLRKTGNMDQAGQLLDLGVRQTSGLDPELYAEMGQLALVRGQAEEAAACFRKALDLDPGHEASHKALSSLGHPVV